MANELKSPRIIPVYRGELVTSRGIKTRQTTLYFYYFRGWNLRPRIIMLGRGLNPRSNLCILHLQGINANYNLIRDFCPLRGLTKLRVMRNQRSGESCLRDYHLFARGLSEVRVVVSSMIRGWLPVKFEILKGKPFFIKGGKKRNAIVLFLKCVIMSLSYRMIHMYISIQLYFFFFFWLRKKRLD